MARSTRTVFPYTAISGRLSPTASAAILLRNAWRAIELYVDSGAAYTILRAEVATAVGFNYLSGNKVFVQVGDGASIPVFLHPMRIQIGATQFTAPIGFSPKLGVPFNLLGRLGIFKHFRICFHERRRFVSFETLP